MSNSGASLGGQARERPAVKVGCSCHRVWVCGAELRSGGTGQDHDERREAGECQHERHGIIPVEEI